MQAIRIHRFGGPEVLSLDDIPAPSAGAQTLLVKVRASSLNPVDSKTREGAFAPVSEAMLPVTLGWDIAGTVAAGTAGGFRQGDAIVGMLGMPMGGFAEYAVVSPTQVAVKPDRMSYPAAACVPLAGLTAWQGLFEHGKLQPGQRVLVHGGAGGVGHLAVQFAKHRGAQVFATASAADQDFLHELGVDRPIDYRAERFEDVAHDIDLVLDLIGGEIQARSFAVLKPGGALISSVLPPPPERCAAANVRGMQYFAEPNGSALAEIVRLVDEGRVLVTVAQTFPLAQTADAMRLLAKGGLRGKLALQVA